MKRIFVVFALAFSAMFFAQTVPTVLKTEFSTAALAQKITYQNGKKMAISEVLNKYEGKILIIDFWASWCRDCILALPETKVLKENNPEVEFVYFSLDRSHEQWKKGLDKYGIATEENYWFDEGWKNNFNNYVDLNWVPRFLIVDRNGAIAKYYAISPTDPDIQKTIDSLKK